MWKSLIWTTRYDKAESKVAHVVGLHEPPLGDGTGRMTRVQRHRRVWRRRHDGVVVAAVDDDGAHDLVRVLAVGVHEELVTRLHGVDEKERVGVRHPVPRDHHVPGRPCETATGKPTGVVEQVVEAGRPR